MPQGRYKRRQPFIQFATPIRIHRQPPEKLAPYESPESSHGNPQNYKSAKVVLGLRLIQSQKAKVVANATADRKLAASLS